MTKVNQRIVVCPDLQIPLHDQLAVSNFLKFIRDFEPTALVNVGDDIDSPETSAWNKSLAGEYAGTLQESIDKTREIHSLFRLALGDKPYHVSRSNHGDRTQRYIDRYAPALAGLRCLQLPEFLGYTESGIIFHDQPFEFGIPGWVCAHGDEGSLSRIAGRTAAGLAEKWGVNVVAGHSHRAGIAWKSYGYGGHVNKSVCGMEAGHLMDQSQADYLKGGHADWMQAFGLILASGDVVSPVVVPVHEGGRFVVEGVVYGG